MKRIISILLFLSFLTALSVQARKVTGIVADENGESVIGAIVQVAGSKQKAITDMDGKYSLDVPDDTAVKLQVSYFGYELLTKTLSPTAQTMDFKLKPKNKEMDEVVVVGYGTQKKSSLTSSIEVIKGEDIVAQPTNNIDEALGGQVAGLGVVVTTGDPSSNKEADIRVRGISGAPLLVIDGVPRFGNNTSDGETRLSDLNPDDIESISVLKDAAASAVYGARAANGVILVKTKRGGKEGKIRVNYRGQFNVSQATYLPNFLNAHEYASLYNRIVDEEQAAGLDVHQKFDLEQIKSNPNLYGDNNLLDYLNKSGYNMRHSLSVSGGNEHISYMITGGYSKNKGLYSNMGRDRFNYGLKLDAKLAKGLTLAVDAMGTMSNNKNTSFTTLDAAYSYSPLQVFRYTDGSLASLSGSNPLINVDGLGGYYRYQGSMQTLSGTLRYETPWEWSKGLSVYFKGTYDNNSTITTRFNKPVALYLYDEFSGQTAVDANTIYPNAKITYQQEDRFIKNLLLEAGANYNRTFAEKHEVGATAVINYQSYNNLYMMGKNNNMAGSYPEIMGTATDASLNGTENYNQRASFIGRANYGYDRRYYGEFSFRMDGSTKFDAAHRWGFFPTVSGSWVVSNEPFFRNYVNRYLCIKEKPIFSQFKLRASTGWLGVDAGLTDFNYQMNYIFSPGAGYFIGGNYAPGLLIDTGTFPNPDLKMEKSHDYNFGLDLGFWDNRFSLTYEYYTRYRTNMIMAAPSYLFPPSMGTGGASPSINSGELKAWGWDLSIGHRNTIGKWKYNVSFNISKTDDVILDYGDESNATPSQRRVGTNYSVWSLYEADGLFQTVDEILSWPVDQDGMGNSTLRPGDIKYKDLDGNGVLTEADKIYVKNSSYPAISYGINLGVQWKGIRLSAQFQGAGGYNARLNDNYTLESSSLQRFQDYHLNNTWTPDNPNADYPRLKFASRNDNNRLESSYWVRRCNYLRLKSLTIGYSIPRSLLNKSGISTLDINFTAGNLFTFSSLHNMDPESLRNYPLQRTFGLSLNFGF